jgi:alginate O-acetyltransferase complex protein AlgI
MGSDNSFFWIFLDILVLTPFFILFRFAFPYRTAVLWLFALSGLYIYYLVGPRFMMFFIVFWGLVYGLQFVLRSAASWPAVLGYGTTAAAILLVMSPMIWWKISPDQFALFINEVTVKALAAVAPGAGLADTLFGLIVPVGLSFTIFRALDLLIKVRIGLLDPVRPLPLFAYGFFPPLLALGPIAEIEELKLDAPVQRKPDPGDIAVGLARLAIGLIKVLFLAIVLERTAAYFWFGGKANWWQIWCAVLAYGAYFYVNFSGYSDLAIGLARLWGIRLKENFDNPFMKTNPQAFWAAWHMSLTRWAQRYVFVPLGGMRKNRQYFAVFATIMVIALWHGLELPLVIFGLYHAIILLGHRWLDERRRARGLALSSSAISINIKRFAVFAYVSLSIPLFNLSLEEIPRFYLSLNPFSGT